jgi:hypothetical protein
MKFIPYVTFVRRHVHHSVTLAEKKLDSSVDHGYITGMPRLRVNQIPHAALTPVDGPAASGKHRICQLGDEPVRISRRYGIQGLIDELVDPLRRVGSLSCGENSNLP